MRRAHIVPLARQTLELLQDLRPWSSKVWLFPGELSKDRPISDNTLRCALRRMGYSNDDITPHGFRSMASTFLNESGFNVDWIERQLAHAPKDQVRAAYNYAEHLEGRHEMMQWWADKLDELEAMI